MIFKEPTGQLSGEPTAMIDEELFVDPVARIYEQYCKAPC